MNLFRNLLFWLLLALVGALFAQLLVQDPGEVLVRFRGTDYRTTVVGGLVLLAAVLFAAWLLWIVVTLPFRGWRGFRRRQDRARLADGMAALHQGHWARAEKLLELAAERSDTEVQARLGAAQAALARGDAAAAERHLAPLAARHPVAHALAAADLALALDRPDDALAALDARAAQPLPPRGQLMRAETLASLGRAHEAYGMLGTLRTQHAAPSERLDLLQARWAAAALHGAGDANVLAERWDGLPASVRSEPDVVGAYAARAAGLRWDEAAAASLEQALDARWDESLVDIYGRLPIGRLDARRATLERWLAAHPSSAALPLALARIARAQGNWPQAEEHLHRALAQGAGSEAWEELGDGFAAAGDEANARLSYANALRAAHGEPITARPDRDLRQRIFDRAVGEERDAHGVPHLKE
jgi:HemY protein